MTAKKQAETSTGLPKKRATAARTANCAATPRVSGRATTQRLIVGIGAPASA